MRRSKSSATRRRFGEWKAPRALMVNPMPRHASQRAWLAQHGSCELVDRHWRKAALPALLQNLVECRRGLQSITAAVVHQHNLSVGKAGTSALDQDGNAGLFEITQ